MTHEERLAYWVSVVTSRSLAASIVLAIEAGISEKVAAQTLAKVWDDSWLDGTFKSEPWTARASEMVAAHRFRTERAEQMVHAGLPQEGGE
jgi:hypothetical protein